MEDCDVSDMAVVVTDPASLGRALQKRRKTLGLRQEDVALQSGISRPTLMAIEAGKETAQIGLVLQVCRDLGLRLVLGAD